MRLSRERTAAQAGLLLIALVGGCYKEPVAITTYPPSGLPGSGDPSQSAQPNPSVRATSAAPTADCVSGWTTPEPAEAAYDDALAVLAGQLGVDAPWQLDALRYFTGPDTSWSATPADIVERWYVRGALANDASFRGRFLIERRSDLDARLVAVAPYESTGFASPDWTGFIGDSEPHTYLGLPGRWSGTPYDFVSGGAVVGGPGLPGEVIGCVSDT